MNSEKIQVVRNGYNLIGDAYAQDRATFGSEKYLRKLMQIIKPGEVILDLGCGDGLPVDRILLKNGYQVIGIDLAEKQIERAKRNCPDGEYKVGDLGELKQEKYKVGAVVCLYTMFHIPRSRHGERLKVMSSYLSKGGVMLVSMGDKEFEGMTKFHGQPMWWSQWGPKKNREFVEKVGLEVIIDEIDQTGGEKHQMILARMF